MHFSRHKIFDEIPYLNDIYYQKLQPYRTPLLLYPAAAVHKSEACLPWLFAQYLIGSGESVSGRTTHWQSTALNKTLNYEVLWKHSSDFYYFSLSSHERLQLQLILKLFSLVTGGASITAWFLTGNSHMGESKGCSVTVCDYTAPQTLVPASTPRTSLRAPEPLPAALPARPGPEGKQGEGGMRNCWMGQTAGWGRSDRLTDSTMRNSWISQPGKGALGEKQPKFTATWRENRAPPEEQDLARPAEPVSSTSNTT